MLCICMEINLIINPYGTIYTWSYADNHGRLQESLQNVELCTHYE